MGGGGLLLVQGFCIPILVTLCATTAVLLNSGSGCDARPFQPRVQDGVEFIKNDCCLVRGDGWFQVDNEIGFVHHGLMGELVPYSGVPPPLISFHPRASGHHRAQHGRQEHLHPSGERLKAFSLLECPQG